MASADEIPAGGEGKITVTVKAGDRRQSLRQLVSVQTNAPEQEKVTLVVTANVLVDLEGMPTILRFTEEQPIAQITLKNYTGTPVRLSNINSSNEYVEVSVSAMTIPPNGEVMLTGKLLPNIPKGIVNGWVKIQTNLKSTPIIQVRIWGKI